MRSISTDFPSKSLSLLDRLSRFDRAVLLGVRRFESRAATQLFRAFTRLGDTSSWAALGLALAASGGSGPTHASRLATAALVAVALSQVLKRLWCRPRPTHGIVGFSALVELPDAFSFPSGHTAVAFSVAVALAGAGQALGPLALLLAIAIGASRIYLGAHYPLDVAAGAVVGVSGGALVRLLLA